MPISPDQLDNALRRGLAPAYLVAGEEPLLVIEAGDAIRRAARDAGFDDRTVFSRDRGIEVADLRTSCSSGSLFSTRRMIEIDCGDKTPDAELSAWWREWLKAPDPDVLVIMLCGKLDGRQRSSAWVKAADTAGGFVYGWPVRPGELDRWVAGRARAAGLRLTDDAVALLAERTEGNLLAAVQDIQKLRLVDTDGPIDADTVRDAVADSAHIDTFEWVNRVLTGDAPAVERGLRRMRGQGESVIALVAAMAWTVRQLCAVASVADSGGGVGDALYRQRIPKMRHRAMESALGRLGLRGVVGWQRRLAAIDSMAKRGQEQRAWEELLTCALRAAGVRAAV